MFNAIKGGFRVGTLAIIVAGLAACSDPVPPQAQYPQQQPQIVQQAPAQPVVVNGGGSGFDAGSAALGAMAGMALSGGGSSRGSDYDRGYGRNTVTRTKTIIIDRRPAKTYYSPAKKTTSFGSFTSSKKVSLSKRRR